MTDELKFYDPETGKPLHSVPEGATISAHTPHGDIKNGQHRWHPEGSFGNIKQEDGIPRFTREPIAPPPPPPPTEPGFYRDKDGYLWELDGDVWLYFGNSYSLKRVRHYAPFSPVTLVPTETWDRLRALDPEDTRDRVDRCGHWLKRAGFHVVTDWVETLAYHHVACGPLRFADEVNGDEYPAHPAQQPHSRRA